MTKYESLADAPLEVRKRYFQIKYSKYFLAISRLYSRITLTLKERNKNKALEKTLQTYHREAERAKNRDNKCIHVLMNMALYFLIAERDIQAVKIDALTHHNKWKRNLSLRIILLTIYEWDMGKASNKELKNLLIKSSVDEELQKQLFNSLREIRKAQEKAAKLLHVERNTVIAHRDPDALSQIKTINRLNSKIVFNAAGEFYSATEQFMFVFPKILQQAGSLEGLFSFMLNKNT